MGLLIMGAVVGYFIFKLITTKKEMKEINENDRRAEEEIIAVWNGNSKSYKTSAFDEGKVYDIVERNRYPVLRPASEPAPYIAPPKPKLRTRHVPKPVENVFNNVVEEYPRKEVSSVAIFSPNKLLTPLIAETKDEYQLPSGEVDMPLSETAAIVAVILYFINNEPEIGITKLESYVIMLDNMCYENTGERLFHYRLTQGVYGYYIQNFRAFLDFIEEKNILSKYKKYYDKKKYRLDFTAHQVVPDDIFPKEILAWMKIILAILKGAGARHTKKYMLSQLKPEAIAAFMSLQSLN